MILLENANFRALKCAGMFYPVIFGKSVENSQDVAMFNLPQIIGETFPTYWETSPLVGNYLKSQVLTSSL